ncbi:MBL fold metallo-hydrolase [Bacilliculturomica massiliensis]|uniref:MBL fold metallo-hydrolase n=1 Tax=Bacilliculturomica massiliensis TaxID=1917867 RepID=UPI0010318980|nr:MBL fold metallo-hydrolase [Bacilliculturomica massiliensis]
MTLGFCSFSSGSSGNCYMVRSNTTALLVDAGISGKKIWEGLERTQTPREMVTALLITHEHSDHTKSVGTVSKKQKDLCVYASEGTWDKITAPVAEHQRRCFQAGDVFEIGDIQVKTFRVSHDAADPVGYSFYSGDRQISIVTDTGYVREETMEEMTGADILVLEANHDVDMLRIGKYPWFLKQRVLSDEGHLSNEAAGNALVDLISRREKERCVLLAHLSRENNFPEMAYQTVKNILEEANYYIGKHVFLDTLLRDTVSSLYEI